MTALRFALKSVAFYRQPYLAVVFGVASAVAVLAGSLMVGSSVRASLVSIATQRLGRTDAAIVAERPFSEGLAARLRTASPAVADAAPVLALQGVVRHPSSGRRATRVSVYGVDARFFALHGSAGLPPASSAIRLSPALATELGAAPGDDILVRIARPTDIPADSLHGRRDDIGRSVRLELEPAHADPAADMREFSLSPGQAPVRAVFIALSRLQRELDLPDRVNALLLRGAAPGAPLGAPIESALSQAVAAEDLGLKLRAADSGGVIVESAAGLIPGAVATVVERGAAKAGLQTEPVLTWLANGMTIAGRSVPYSIVTAVGPNGGGDAGLAALLRARGDGPPPIVLTAWAADDLQAKAGDALDLEYYRWTDEGRLVTDRASFLVAGIVPMRGPAIDRQWAPDYPGITGTKNFADWDPPFPIDLKRVRQKDEDYWDQYRTAPKAFLPLEVGQRLWRSRHGQATSIRVGVRPGSDRGQTGVRPGSDPILETIASLAREVSPADAGLKVIDIRAQTLSASAGATDFGAYFSYFSFFLMVAALLLAGLFFRLSLEERQAQVGVLRASGLTSGDVRRLLLTEGVLVVLPAVVLGAALAVGWAALMMYGLRTWWVDAVGTTLLELHVDPVMLAIGAAGGAVAAILAIVMTVRAASRTSPRNLLTGAMTAVAGSSRSRARAIAIAALLTAILMSVLAGAGVVAASGAFFGAGTLVLVAGLAGFGGWLRSRAASNRLAPESRRGRLTRLGLANASWRPGRSLTSVGLVAAAVFLLVSVDSFRKRVDASAAGSPGTGGFALIAQSELPIVHDVSSPEGWREAGLDDSAGSPLAGVTLMGLRLRPGDDASCLNLYQPRRPRIAGVPRRMMETAPFVFARSLASTDAERANPWQLLGPPDRDGIVPAIVDATSLQYVLHSGVGEVIEVDADTARPIRLRIVGSLADSVLQGEILIGDAAFSRLFPDLPGYRMFLAAVPGAPEARDAAARALEQTLADFGFDAEDAAERLESFHRVENTYLSTFQALGGLGLALGCLGLVAVVARNVLERRRELALLGASGYTGGDLQKVVASEHVSLVAAGLIVGVAAALVAVAPVVYARGGALPWAALVWLAPVAAAGLLSAILATRRVRRLPLVPSLRRE
jgi:ABC-type antimicrobial peptide transport system permease subunit